MVRFTFGKNKFCSTIKESQNIMNMILDMLDEKKIQSLCVSVVWYISLKVRAHNFSSYRIETQLRLTFL